MSTILWYSQTEQANSVAMHRANEHIESLFEAKIKELESTEINETAFDIARFAKQVLSQVPPTKNPLSLKLVPEGETNFFEIYNYANSTLNLQLNQIQGINDTKKVETKLRSLGRTQLLTQKLLPKTLFSGEIRVPSKLITGEFIMNATQSVASINQAIEKSCPQSSSEIEKDDLETYSQDLEGKMSELTKTPHQNDELQEWLLAIERTSTFNTFCLVQSLQEILKTAATPSTSVPTNHASPSGGI